MMNNYNPNVFPRAAAPPLRFPFFVDPINMCRTLFNHVSSMFYPSKYIIELKAAHSEHEINQILDAAIQSIVAKYQRKNKGFHITPQEQQLTRDKLSKQYKAHWKQNVLSCLYNTVDYRATLLSLPTLAVVAIYEWYTGIRIPSKSILRDLSPLAYILLKTIGVTYALAIGSLFVSPMNPTILKRTRKEFKNEFKNLATKVSYEQEDYGFSFATQVAGDVLDTETQLQQVQVAGVLQFHPNGAPILKKTEVPVWRHNIPLDKYLAYHLIPLYENPDQFIKDYDSIRLRAFKTLKEISPNTRVRHHDLIVRLALHNLPTIREYAHELESHKQEMFMRNISKQNF